MAAYKFGDIVLIKFPFTNSTTFKKRPALIIKDTLDGDVVVCRITSKLYNSAYDFELKNWAINGLKMPSVIRIHKIASLDSILIDFKLGELTITDESAVSKIITLLLQP